jgi:hypothetical protein
MITGQAWPALMIGELAFARAGVHVRAGSEHAVPGFNYTIHGIDERQDGLS